MFIDVDANFPALRALASNFEAIRDEALAIDPADYFEYIQREIFTGSWRLFVLYSEVEDWTYANAVEENRRRCPRTWELVKDVPDKVLVGFSYLAPQTHVYPHVDNDRPYMHGDEDTARCHLGLVVPTGSPIRIGGVLDEYREGHFHAFDARRHVHEVGNRSNEGRINLCVEVKYRLEDLAVPPGHGTARATER